MSKINKFRKDFSNAINEPDRKKLYSYGKELLNTFNSMNENEKKAVYTFLSDRQSFLNDLRKQMIPNSDLNISKVNIPYNNHNDKACKYNKDIDEASVYIKDEKKRKGICATIKQYMHCAFTGDCSELDDDHFAKKYLIPFLYFVSDKFATCDDSVIETALIKAKVPENYKPTLRKVAKSFKGFVISRQPKVNKEGIRKANIPYANSDNKNMNNSNNTIPMK